MKQEYVLLQCHSCRLFQVHIDKKSRSFKCSVCGAKQPYSRVFARSCKASDCRNLCSDYNKKGHAVSSEEREEAEGSEEYALQAVPDDDTQSQQREIRYITGGGEWDEFLEADVVNEGEEQDNCRKPVELENSRWKEDAEAFSFPESNRSRFGGRYEPYRRKNRGERAMNDLNAGKYTKASGTHWSMKQGDDREDTLVQARSIEKAKDSVHVNDQNAAWFAEYLSD